MNPMLRCMLTAVLLAGLIPLAGCGAFLTHFDAHPITIAPIDKKPELAIEPNLQSIYYRVDRDHNIDIVMQDPQARRHAADRPADDERIILRIFWQPRGGVTSLNKQSIDATFRYIVTNASGAGMYEGAGFIRLYGKAGGSTLTARIMDGDLRLTQATAHFVDALGRAKFTGAFTAKRSDSITVARMLQDQRNFFSRTYKFAQADEAVEAANTQPAPTP